MRKSKHDQDSSSSMSNSNSSATTPLWHKHKLNEDVVQKTDKYLSLKEIAALARLSKINSQLYQPILDTAKAVHPLLTAVVHGNPEELCRLVQENPALLFQKGQVTDLDGQIFYDVSPYQLMTFLCDEGMKQRIMSMITTMTEEMTHLRQKQYAEIDSGGADLINMDRDPELLEFEEVTRFIASYTIDEQATSVTFPLLENPDGIIFYKDSSTGLGHLYYANQKTKTVELIEPKAHSKKEYQALARLYASFDAMENNSSRRSNSAEHALIAATMQHKLSRKGIQYERDGVRYCDNRMAFDLVNAYRKCIRFYQDWNARLGDESWRHDVGQAQRRIMWVLQRICEEGRPFYPLPDFKASPFRRSFLINNYRTTPSVHESLFLATRLDPGLGSDFALFKDCLGGRTTVVRGGAARRCGYWPYPRALVDMIAVCRLIEDAKANVVEFTPSVDLNSHNAAENLHQGPG